MGLGIIVIGQVVTNISSSMPSSAFDLSSLTQYGFGGVSLAALVIAIIDNLRKSNASYVKKLEDRFQLEIDEHKARITKLETELQEERTERLKLLEELREHRASRPATD